MRLVVDRDAVIKQQTHECASHIQTRITIYNSSQGLVWIHDNDPSAGSPTETLLRLLLPLDDRVCVTSRSKARLPEPEPQSERLTRPSNR